MDAFSAWLWGTGWFWFAMFWAALAVNGRAVFKLLLDWKGMLTTCRFVERAYATLDTLPDEAALEHDRAAPVFVHLVPAWQEPDIAATLSALLGSRYPHAKLHVVVATRESEKHSPHPTMAASTAELVRRFRDGLPPWQQKMLSIASMPGEGRKAHQLNWALRPEALKPLLDLRYDPARVWIGLSDADSIPDPNVYRWIAADLARHRGRLAYQGVTLSLANFARLNVRGLVCAVQQSSIFVRVSIARLINERRRVDTFGRLAAGAPRAGRGRLAYQGVTLSLANFARLNVRGRVCAVQQSSIFVRVSIARLINERRRIDAFGRLAAWAPRAGRVLRPLFDLCFRRSQICLGHNQFVRLDALQNLGGFPTTGATEDSTLGYALGSRGILMAPMPMLELVDMPETTNGMIRQNARWYKGVLDDVRFLRDTRRARPSAYNLAQLARHVGNKVVEWPVAALVYPVLGFLGWHLAYRFSDHPVWFALGVGFPTLSLALTVWVGGIVTQDLIERLTPNFPRPVSVARTTLKAKFWGIFRCQTYWLLATRGAWRVLWALVRTGRFEPTKTDRVARRRKLQQD